jgi:hypothetical protein
MRGTNVVKTKQPDRDNYYLSMVMWERGSQGYEDDDKEDVGGGGTAVMHFTRTTITAGNHAAKLNPKP